MAVNNALQHRGPQGGHRFGVIQGLLLLGWRGNTDATTSGRLNGRRADGPTQLSPPRAAKTAGMDYWVCVWLAHRGRSGRCGESTSSPCGSCALGLSLVATAHPLPAKNDSTLRATTTVQQQQQQRQRWEGGRSDLIQRRACAYKIAGYRSSIYSIIHASSICM